MSHGLTVHPVAGALGAEISGVDLAKPLDDATVAGIRQAWLEHLVVFFRDQDLSPAQFLAFARRFGDPIEYPFVKGLDDYPEIIPVLKLANERVNFGGIWHSDTAYLDVPPMASMLIAREVPPAGGDTLFANMYLAYETLSDGMKRVLEPLVGINSSASADVSRTREDRLKDSARGDAKKEYVAGHPVVRVHPETGRRALYVNVAHTVGFEGMTREESAPLLDHLFRHQVRPELTCRFRWQPGSIAFWDNRCAQHNAINDYQGHRRLMHRITLAGDKPKGV
jgi:taurine dioxygenase